MSWHPGACAATRPWRRWCPGRLLGWIQRAPLSRRWVGSCQGQQHQTQLRLASWPRSFPHNGSLTRMRRLWEGRSRSVRVARVAMGAVRIKALAQRKESNPERRRCRTCWMTRRRLRALRARPTRPLPLQATGGVLGTLRLVPVTLCCVCSNSDFSCPFRAVDPPPSALHAQDLVKHVDPFHTAVALYHLVACPM